MKNPIEVGRHKMFLECSCGCSTLQIEYWEPFEDGDYFVSLTHNISSFSALQGNFWTRLKIQMKILWSIIIGKEYCFYEISLESKEKIEEFKEFVANIDETKAIYE